MKGNYKQDRKIPVHDTEMDRKLSSMTQKETMIKIRDTQRTGNKRSAFGLQAKNNKSLDNAGVKITKADSTVQPLPTKIITRRQSKAGSSYKQILIKFRYSDAVKSYAHHIIGDVRYNPNVTMPPAPEESPESPFVEVHHPEKLDFERMFTKIIPVQVENGRLCITPKPGFDDGQRTSFVFSVLSNLEIEDRCTPCPPENSSIQFQEKANCKRVCFCLPSIEDRAESIHLEKTAKITHRTITIKRTESDNQARKRDLLLHERNEIKMKLPPIRKNGQSAGALSSLRLLQGIKVA